ncbi:hypothetical protein FQR65_LT10457 [Abscondita terminalis]|nr:hypothetical protein FQR65_LT10457 [Abscondita terminalis]
MGNLRNNSDGLVDESISIPSTDPVKVSSPEASIDTDNDSVCSEEFAEHLSIPNQVFSSGATVHIDNSSDVVIGPLTQFHGPVTIYQNIKSENTNERKSLPLNGNVKTNNNNSSTVGSERIKVSRSLSGVLFKAPNKRLLIYSVIIFAILLAIVLGLVLSFKTFTNSNNENGEHTKNDRDDIKHEIKTTVTPLMSHKIFDREDWGGRPSKNFTKPLTLPVEYVMISHTAGRFCRTFSECSSIVQQIQSMHVSHNSPDIGYNFLIGGDGNVYVGRGWDIVNYHQDGMIGISFIGNYVFDELLPNMISALEELLGVGVKFGKLTNDYKLVCHNQTFATLSPGQNVYIKISQMPHFYEGRI